MRDSTVVNCGRNRIVSKQSYSEQKDDTKSERVNTLMTSRPFYCRCSSWWTQSSSTSCCSPQSNSLRRRSSVHRQFVLRFHHGNKKEQTRWSGPATASGPLTASFSRCRHSSIIVQRDRRYLLYVIISTTIVVIIVTTPMPRSSPEKCFRYTCT